MEIEFEPVESPEYIAHCEANNYGYTSGVSTCGQWVQQKVWISSDITNKEFRLFNTRILEEFTGKAPDPYRITFENGTYRTAHEKVDDFLNSMEWGICMPKGTQGITSSEIRMIIDYTDPNKPDEKKP